MNGISLKHTVFVLFSFSLPVDLMLIMTDTLPKGISMVDIRHAKLQAVVYSSDSSDDIILQILLLVLHLQCANGKGFGGGGWGGFDRSRLTPRQFLVCVCVKSAVKYEEKKLWGEGVCVWAP